MRNTSLVRGLSVSLSRNEQTHTHGGNNGSKYLICIYWGCQSGTNIMCDADDETVRYWHSCLIIIIMIAQVDKR